MIRKIFKTTFIFIFLFGMLFSNFPADFLTEIADKYQEGFNIVDKMWKLQSDSNVVDKFIPFSRVIEKLRIPNALALSAAQGDGLVIYGVAANTTPKWRTYSASSNTFGAAAATVAGTTGLNFVVRTSPTKQEAIAGYVNASGGLQMMCYDGTSWTNQWTATAGGTGTTRRFDIAYETNSGDVMVVYSANAAATNALKYRFKLGSTDCGAANWSAEQSFPTSAAATTGTVAWVKMAWDKRASSNLITVIWADNNADLGVDNWNGTAWETAATTLKALETSLECLGGTQGAACAASTAPSTEDFDVEYESLSGDIIVVWANYLGTNAVNGSRYSTCTGGISTCSWLAATAITAMLDDATNLDISANPNTDEIIFASIGDAGADLQANYWNGSAWNATGKPNLDITSQAQLAGTKLVATGWLISGATTRSIIAYNDSNVTNIGYYQCTAATCTAGTDWVSAPVLGNPQKVYDIQTDPFNKDRLLFTISDVNSDLFAKRLIMTATPAFTWTNSDSSAALEANLSLATVGDFNFAYWRAMPSNTTTLATGSDPAATTIAPEAAATDVNTFTLQTNSGTESISSVTVNLSTNSGIGTLAITDNANTVLGSTASPVAGSNTITVAGMSAGTSVATFKVRATPLSHAAMPAPAGAAYAITAPVTAWAGINTHAGSDTNTNALTIDNLSPAGTTNAVATPGNAQVALSWTNPADSDFQKVIIYCKTASITETPTEGADPAVDGAACDATARVKYSGLARPQTIASLTNGTTYYFRIFARDSNGNFTVIGSTQQVSAAPVAPTPTLTISASAGAKVTVLNSGDTSQFAHNTSCTTDGTCAAFKLAASNGAATVTSIKITEFGTADAYNNLSNPTLIYDTDANYSNGTAGTFGTAAAFAADQTATLTNAGLSIPDGSTYYFYIRFDLVKAGTYPAGGYGIDFKINAATDVVSTSEETGTAALVSAASACAATSETCVRPNATAATWGSGLSDGGRSSESITISGYGFGVAPVGSRGNCSGAVNTGCIRFTVGGNATVATGDVSDWSNTSISFTINSSLASYGGAQALEAVAGSQADATKLSFIIYPNVTGMTTCSAGGDRDSNCGTNSAEEYNAADTYGLVMLTGDHFNTAAGSAAFTGGFGSIAGTVHATAEGPCSVGGWGASGTGNSVCIEVNSSISNTVYDGTVTLTRTGDSKTDLIDLHILPRIISNTSSSGMAGDTIAVAGDHFCQTGSCPSSPPTTDYIAYFGTAQALAADFSTTCAGGLKWTDTQACVKVPAGAPLGVSKTKIQGKASPLYESQRKTFTVLSSVPNNPDVGPGASKGQYLSDGTTAINIGGLTNQSTVVFKMEMSASVMAILEPQVEIQDILTSFTNSPTATGTAVAYSGTPVTGTITISSIATNAYHWQARVKNMSTGEYSNWVSFGGNGEGATDFQIDVTAPTIIFPVTDTCDGAVSSLSTNSVTISWSLSESADGQLEYSKNSNLSSSTLLPLSPEAAAFSHAFNLTNLDSNTTYYFRVKSTDTANNQAVRPSGAPYCSFATVQVTQPAKTTSFYIMGHIDPLTSASTTYFTVLIPENSPSVKSAFVEVSGLVSGGTNPISIQVNGVAAKSYSVNATNPTYFKFIYQIANPNSQTNLNLNDEAPCTNGAAGLAPCNKLILTPGSGMSVNEYSAKIYATYSYTP